ncbi:carbon catabolite repressor-like protein [Trifolium pratense]|uniref:Carbon catabolite repressor-like protein n=1 Tax=Trifolium pratense TaxID=57577 RepID=A0A2K3MES2_TRIPR|nr:carbon catabolite repressor-like protein [Trifolium pratense]
MINFVHCRWKYRSNSILDVLKNLGADFFCLQEIDEFYTFYKGRMLELGYSSIYMKRSGEQKRDGCGLFYKHDWMPQHRMRYTQETNHVL